MARLKLSTKLHYSVIVDRGDFDNTIGRQFGKIVTLKKLDNLIKKHSQLPWRIFHEDKWYIRKDEGVWEHEDDT